MRLPSKDSSAFRGLVTGIQSFLGAVVVLVVALWAAVNGVPGCSEAILNVLRDNVVILAGGFGISSGAVSFLWNFAFRKDVKNY